MFFVSSQNSSLELLEILQANDTIDLAQNIIDEFDRDHDGKLSVDGTKNQKINFYIFCCCCRINWSY